MSEQGVYVDLESLTKLQYKARGFSFLPRQPVHSVLTGRYASRVAGARRKPPAAAPDLRDRTTYCHR